jgi:hypothetical protein
MYDSSNLSWKLATMLRGAPAWLLETYNEERHTSAQREIQIMHDRMYLATDLDYKSDGRAGPNPRQLLAALNDPTMAMETSGLLIKYRDSPLSLNWGETDGKSVQAGDRAPDSPCLDPASGETVRLFELFRGPHWTLLGFGVRGAEAVRNVQPPEFVDLKVHAVLKPGEGATDVETVIDAEGLAHGFFEVGEDAIVLVRPDNVIGLIARPADQAALDAYFDRLRDGPNP